MMKLISFILFALVLLIFTIESIGHKKIGKPQRSAHIVTAQSESQNKLVIPVEAKVTNTQAHHANMVTPLSTPEAFKMIDGEALAGNDDGLAAVLNRKDLSSAARVYAIEVLFSRGEERLQMKAEEQLQSMISSGSQADVIAILNRFQQMPSFAQQDIVNAQASLCRFQTSQEKQGFEWLKAKFSLVTETVRPALDWSDTCKG